VTEKLFIHIGYHKTGSTWLQRFVFGDEQSGFCWIGRRWAARQWIVAPNALDYDPEIVLGSCHAEMTSALQRGLVPVLSDERLSGNPHSGGYDSKEIATRLHATFPKAKILIVIRRQQDIILSAYDQYVDEGGACSLQDYLRPPRTRLAMPSFRLEHFQYHRLIGTYQSLFGVDRVLVQCYERFRDAPSEFLPTMLRFAGGPEEFSPNPAVRVNVGRSAVATELQRRTNLFAVRDDVNAYSVLAIPNSRRAIAGAVRALAALSPESWNRKLRARRQHHVECLCQGIFGTSNASTASMTGLDLGSYGYDLMSAADGGAAP
jgi:hypothetical protein